MTAAALLIFVPLFVSLAVLGFDLAAPETAEVVWGVCAALSAIGYFWGWVLVVRRRREDRP